MSAHSIPSHRRRFWISIIWWCDMYQMEEEGFVIKDGKKVLATYRLCGFCFIRWWELVKDK